MKQLGRFIGVILLIVIIPCLVYFIGFLAVGEYTGEVGNNTDVGLIEHRIMTFFIGVGIIIILLLIIFK